MFAPAKIDIDWIRMIDAKSSAKFCVSCLQEEARWIVGTPATAEPWCGYCFLNKTKWGTDNQPGIVGLAEEYGHQSGEQTVIDGIVVRKCADRILGAIVSGSRTMQILKRASK